MTPDSCKRLRLEGIPEEDKLPEPQQKKIEDVLLSDPKDTPPGSPQQLEA